MTFLRRRAAASLLAFLPSGILAQDVPDSLSFGAAMVPDYDGSADYVLRPAATGRLTYGTTTIELLGTGARIGLRADLVNGYVAAGPVLNYRFGRNDDVENVSVAALPEIEGAAELGLFFSYPITRELALSLEAVADVSACTRAAL